MNELPYEIKLTYIIVIAIMLLFVGFIIFVVMTYNRKQLLFLKEKQLREAEYQNSLLHEELKRQQAIQKERERISHDMHDELGAGISALKLQVEFLKQKVSEEETQQDMHELLQTAESMNLSMREMLWSLNVENDNLGNFVQYLCNYAENFFRKTNIQLNCIYSEINPEKNISSEIRRNLLLCVKEALNNIYKHAQANQITIEFHQLETSFSIDIKDNGKGLPADLQYGNGFSNMKIRMRNISGKFEFIPRVNGLHLQFSFPIPH
ncbi:sensor histidine kinase [Moheibacter sediminis]|uniref:histidine kinase n=1 Tax=Moheibacter sediminis TaxID=1434700 RepID=A0A1W1Y9U1_9FLAO|nr:histidine kinase [Moheibacter sediminis]SMC32916.1 two-component system, NarL family, sensor histidine kinase DesK [Moheibacter sediminis]